MLTRINNYKQRIINKLSAICIRRKLMLVAVSAGVVPAGIAAGMTTGNYVYAEEIPASVVTMPDILSEDTQDNDEKSQEIIKKPPVIKQYRVSSASCRLKWSKVKDALWYSIYRKESDDSYVCIKKKVKNNVYTDNKLKEKERYKYRISAVYEGADGEKYSTAQSRPVSVKTSKKTLKYAYVGDSIMYQLKEFNLVKGKNRKVIGKIGVSPYTFYINPLMDKLLDYKPDRMYIMLGMNAIEGNPTAGQYNMVIKFYKKILKACLKENPDMQIVVLPVSPVRPGADTKNSVINHYNKMVRSMADKMKLDYYDYRDGMMEKDGTLNREYAEGDRVHWKLNGCVKFKELLYSYDKETYTYFSLGNEEKE